MYGDFILVKTKSEGKIGKSSKQKFNIQACYKDSSLCPWNMLCTNYTKNKGESSTRETLASS